MLLKGVGASSIDVEPVFLLGQGAPVYALGQMPRPTQLEDGDQTMTCRYGHRSAGTASARSRKLRLTWPAPPLAIS